jgi:TPR repeat protein
MNLHNNKPISFFANASALAGNNEGQEAFEKGDFQTVLKVANQLVEKGNPQGPWSLGWLYEHGKAVPQDYNLAASWYTKAAEQGLRDAQSKLGWLYESGLGVPQDYNLAASWYTKAAKQGLPEAQSHLGRLYYNGQGVPQDYKLADKWFTKAAIRGDAKAQYNLGVMYENGKGHEKDESEAVTWFMKAADQGFAPAQYNLAVIFVALKKYSLAAHLYTQAAKQGDANAQANLGLMYENGQGVPKSYRLSYALYDLSGKTELRAALMKKMGPTLTNQAQDLSKELAKSENLENALTVERQRLESVGEMAQIRDEINTEVELGMLAMKALLNKWIGASERDLITHPFWGVPQQTYETAGIKYAVYDISSVEKTAAAIPSTATTSIDTHTYSNSEWEGVNSNVKVTNTEGRPAEYREQFCKVLFEVREGKLEKWTQQGSLCVFQLLENRKRGYPNRLGPDGKIPCNKWYQSERRFFPICIDIP